MTSCLPAAGSRPPAPFLKWAGGKAKLAPAVLERAPAAFGAYHEPFLGGGAVFFALAAAGRISRARLCDANAALIACFEAVRDAPDALIAALEPLAAAYRSLPHEARAAMYYRVRACEPAAAIDCAARFIFLNRTCYNGLYRVNSRGAFNVPHGRYANPRILDAEGLRAASAVLQSATLGVADFEEACEAASPGDFVYFDPPYQPLSRTSSFTAYTAGDFGPGDQARLRDTFEALTRRGVAALLSNSDHAAIRELYAGRGYGFDTVPMSRAINSVGTGRAPIPELLIDNFAREEVRAAFAPPA